VLDAIRHTGAIEYTRERARAEAHTACAAIAALPATRHRDYLLQLADFSATRTY
jgi:octaprenyl-diphosphate synthase